ALAALALGACQKTAPAANATSAATNEAAAPSVAGPGASADAADAKAFLDSLYAHYRQSSSTGTTWAPMEADASAVFAPDTVALLQADTKALKGELGEIDGDWLCDCQDWGSIAADVTILSASPAEAKAVAVIRDTEIKDEPPKHDTFDLVKTPAGWRIHDMGTQQDPSLRAVLTKEIADLKAGKKPATDED